jgi:hypothetical protein
MGDFLNVNPDQMGGGVPLMVVIDPPEIVSFTSLLWAFPFLKHHLGLS